MQFTGRFTLSSTQVSKLAVTEKGGKTRMARGVNAVFSAVYGGTPRNDAYHSATPYGKIELNVTNPNVSEPLDDLFRAWILDQESNWKDQPTFEVTFRLLEEKDL